MKRILTAMIAWGCLLTASAQEKVLPLIQNVSAYESM